MGGRGQNYKPSTTKPATTKPKPKTTPTYKPTNTNPQFGHPQSRLYTANWNERVQKTLGVDKQEVTKTSQAFSDWLYDEDRRNLMAYDHKSTPGGAPDVNRIEKYIDRAPKWAGGTIYRAVFPSEAEFKKLTKVGGTFTNDLPTAFTTNEADARRHIAEGGGNRLNATPVVIRTAGTSTMQGTSIRNFTSRAEDPLVMVTGKGKFKTQKVRKRKVKYGPNNKWEYTYTEVWVKDA